MWQIQRSPATSSWGFAFVCRVSGPAVSAGANGSNRPRRENSEQDPGSGSFLAGANQRRRSGIRPAHQPRPRRATIRVQILPLPEHRKPPTALANRGRHPRLRARAGWEGKPPDGESRWQCRQIHSCLQSQPMCGRFARYAPERNTLAPSAFRLRTSQKTGTNGSRSTTSAPTGNEREPPCVKRQIDFTVSLLNRIPPLDQSSQHLTAQLR